MSTISKIINGVNESMDVGCTRPLGTYELESYLFESLDYDGFPIESHSSDKINTTDESLTWVPFTNLFLSRNIYDMFLDKKIEMIDGELVCPFTDDYYKDYIMDNFDIYNSIIEHKGYTKENGFDIQKVKEALEKLNAGNSDMDSDDKDLTIHDEKVLEMVENNEESKEQAIEQYLSAETILEEDVAFQQKYEDLNQLLNIRTLSFFMKDKDEKERVLERLQQVFSNDSEVGKEYRIRIGDRQLWMVEYQSSENFALETPEEPSKGENKLRFLFSPDSVKAGEFFIYADKEDTKLDMDKVMDFL